jgi:hypothetical protein
MSGDHSATAYLNHHSAHGELEKKQSYAVADFLNFHDEQFVLLPIVISWAGNLMRRDLHITWAGCGPAH